MKKIVLFSDGTGNSSANPHKTNVWRAYQALDLSASRKQIAYYDNGVGTSAFTPTAILGLAFGWGLASNVRQIYKFVCQTYDPGDPQTNRLPDKIFGFGFSRGAYTMRVAVALIADQGIIDIEKVKDEADLDRLVVSAYRKFRKDNFTPSFLSFFFASLRDGITSIWDKCLKRQPYSEIEKHKVKHDGSPLINFIGVWDTVDAYGFPVDEMTRAWDKVIWPLTPNSRNLSKGVGMACHALALDEQRKSFEPMLWNEDEIAQGSTIKQIWFPGVHANVGGGYPDDSLSYLALNWILDESEKNGGLVYQAHVRRRYKNNVTSPQHDSRSGIGNLYRYDPRNLHQLCNDEKPGLFNWLKDKFRRFLNPDEIALNQVRIDQPKIHYSVFERVKKSGDGYAPINVPAKYALITESGQEIEMATTDHTDELYETDSQANQREKSQSYIWNKVGLRKFLQYLTLLTLIIFISYPYWPDAGRFGEFLTDLAERIGPWIGVIIQPINAIPGLIGKIPGLGFAENWARLYQHMPIIFLLFILMIVTLLLLGFKIKSMIKSEMRLNWHHITNKGQPPAQDEQISDFTKSIAGFFSSNFYHRWINKPLKRLVEGLAVIVFLCLLIAVCSQLFFSVIDGVGRVCKEVEVENEFDQKIPFKPDNKCQPLGIEVEKGRVYSITFTVEKDWRDQGVRADVYGWLDNEQSLIYDQNFPEVDGERQLPNGVKPIDESDNVPFYLHLFTPIRRQLFADWYQPVVQIGHRLFDKYPLESSEPDISKIERPRYEDCFPLKARRDGYLYVYLNDAVVAKPELFDSYFYKNNQGKANMIVSQQSCEQKKPSTETEQQGKGHNQK